MALVKPDIILSGNPDAFGIVKETHVTGARSVQTLAELYAISDAILSPSGNNTNNDALGQIWYVSNDTTDTNNGSYRLKDWTNRKSAGGWDKLIVTGSELGQSGVTSVNNLTGDISIVGDDTIDITNPENLNTIKISTTNVVRTDGTQGNLDILLRDDNRRPGVNYSELSANNSEFDYIVSYEDQGTGELSVRTESAIFSQTNISNPYKRTDRRLEFPNYDENNNLYIKLECYSSDSYQGLYFSTGEVTLLASNYDHKNASDLTKAASIQLWNNNNNYAPKITFGIPSTDPLSVISKLFTYEFDTNIGDTSQQNKTIATVDYVDSKVGDSQSDRIKSANEYAVAVATESGTNGTLTLAASGEGGEINLDASTVILGQEHQDRIMVSSSGSSGGISITSMEDDIRLSTNLSGNIIAYASGEIRLVSENSPNQKIDICCCIDSGSGTFTGLKIYSGESDHHIDFYNESSNIAVPLTKSGTLALVEDVGILNNDNTWIGDNEFHGSVSISASGEDIFSVRNFGAWDSGGGTKLFSIKNSSTPDEPNVTVSVGNTVDSFTWKGKTIATTDQIDELKTQIAGGIIYKGKVNSWQVSGENIIISSGESMDPSEVFKNGYMVMLTTSGEVNGKKYDEGDYVIYSGTDEIAYNPGSGVLSGWNLPIADCSFINAQDSNVAKTDDNNTWTGSNTFSQMLRASQIISNNVIGSDGTGLRIGSTGEMNLVGDSEINIFAVDAINIGRRLHGENKPPAISVTEKNTSESSDDTIVFSVVPTIGTGETAKTLATTDQIQTITLPEGTKQLPTDGSYTINDIVGLLNKIAAALGAPVHS